MDKTVLTLGVDSSQVGTASIAFQRMVEAGNNAAASGQKVTNAANQQAKAINSGLTPAARSAKNALAEIATASQKVNGNALAQVGAELARVEAQARRTASAVTAMSRATSAKPSTRFAGDTSPSGRAPLLASAPVGLFTRQLAPVASVSLLAGEAGKAQRAVDKLTGAARTQRTALAQLAPAAATAAASYRELAASPITLAAPVGLQAAAAALASVISSLSNAPRVKPLDKSSAQQNALAAAAARELAEGNKAIGASARLAAFQQQQLAFQLNDFFVQVTSGGSALTALIQQGSQLVGTYGSVGAVFQALLGAITPMAAGIGAAATAVGGLAVAFYQGREASKEFNNAIALSGNFAGKTAGEFNQVTRAVSDAGRATVGAAKDAAQALISTGEIGPQVFDAAVAASVEYTKATGKTAADTAADFAQMSRSPTKWAIEHNRAFNDISAAQIDAIKNFEDTGRTVEATGVIFDAMNAHFANAGRGMDFLSRQVVEHDKFWSNLWNTIKNGVGAPETAVNRLEAAMARLKYAENQLGGGGGRGAAGTFALGGQSRESVLKSLRQDAFEKQRDVLREAENAQATAFNAEAQKKAIAAGTSIDVLLKQARTKGAVLKDEQAKLERSFADRENADVPVSDADKKRARAQLVKNFAPPRTGGGGGGSSASDTLRAQADREIKGFQNALDAERDAFAFHNRFLQGEYQAGKVSLKAFYEDKRATTAKAVEAEIAELEKERATLERLKARTKDPREKRETQDRIDDNVSLQGKVKANADRDIILSNQEEAASFKQLSDQVTNYRANLLQMAGDEAGAAELRSQIEIRAARVLAQQSGGQITQADVDRQIQLSAATREFAKAQQDVAFLTAEAARAEEAFGLAAEQSGKSLIETERGIYAMRVRELEQLGALAAKAKELAEVSTDPRIKAFASELALEYAKAAAAIDPALTRLRDANKELAAGLAGTLGDAPNAFVQEFTQRRAAANSDIKNQRDFYSRRIDLLEGYLATTQDKNDKARLREKIATAEAQRDSVKGESKGRSVLGAISDAVLKPIGEQIFATVNKLLITDPLQKYLEGQLTKLTEGNGALAGFFKDALGIKADPKDAALALQTAAITSSTSALDLLTQAAQAAAGAIGTPNPFAGAPLEAAGEAGSELLNFSKTATAATSDVAKLAAAAGAGGSAMERLPVIVSLFQSAISAFSAKSAGGSSGGIFGLLGSLFGGGGSEAGYEAMAAGGLFHSGGIVGQGSASRMVASSAFAGAPRYHSGGIAGEGADKLRPNEVAAILMGGPKGQREEVITADDPRHRDNLGMNALAMIMAESKHEGMRVRGARELGGPVSANSMYRVNEKRPELLQVAGKQYLMTGSQGGTIDANEGGGKPSQVINVNVNVTPPAGASAATAAQWGATAGRHIKNSLRRNG